MKHYLVAALSALALTACSPQTGDTSMPDTKAPISYAAEGWTAKSLPELAEALKAGDVSAEALTRAYLDRIELVDRSGPTLQAVLTLNPDALEAARALDAKRDAGEPLGALHGLPILLKDNIETADNMPTTAGALALKDNVTDRDSPLVAGLRAEGAIILGKTNLSQWANFRSNSSMSGWSALGGQVRNPHMLDRNPCGSRRRLPRRGHGRHRNQWLDHLPIQREWRRRLQANRRPCLAGLHHSHLLLTGHSRSDDEDGQGRGHDAQRHGDRRSEDRLCRHP
ncbi:hypothetical protein L53_01180 [Hyphomonas sp. L-53-1-40]|nr:hypothetical protein L53_01180 [Hyphomonas sp. L-53-1-40]